MLTPDRARNLARRLVSEEDGVIWAWLAIFLPVAFVLATFVMDVANRFEHQRHLQTQVDAAALAGGGKFIFPNCSDSAIENESLKYGGDLTRLATAFNRQVSPDTNVHVVFNSATYWANGVTTNDNTDGGGPCTTEFLDVKATDDRPPFFFSKLFPGFAPSVHAHARIEVHTLQTGCCSLPLALTDPTPRQARAYFVNENTGAVLTDASGQPATVQLFYNTSSGGLDYWSSVDTSQTPSVYHTVTLPSMPSGEVGIRIALSGSTTNNQCGQPLVVCYDQAPPNQTSPSGIDPVRVYDPSVAPSTGSPLAAVPVYGATLTSTGCTNAYFPTADCAVRLHARVKFPAGITPANVTMTARVDGATQNASQFTMAAGSSTDCPPEDPSGSLCWESTQDVPISGAGWHTINIAWKDTTTTDALGANACKNGACDDTAGPGAIAQRVFEANTAGSGQVELVDLLDSNGIAASQSGSTAFHSYAVGTAPGQLGVRIAILQGYSTGAVTDAARTLRVASGSQTTAVDCNPSTGPYATAYAAKYGNAYNQYTSFSGELQYGCLPDYTKWDGSTACPGAAPGTLYPGSRSTLWNSTTQPWMCADTKTGFTPGDVGQGLNARILNDQKPTTCPGAGQPGHNNWDPGGSATWSPQQLDAADPRIVQVMLAPFGTFGGSGTDTYPITRFAAFYITGWQGNNGYTNPCQNPGQGDDTALPGEIKGHFMTYTETFNKGGGGDPWCDTTGIDVCVAELTQ